VVDQALQQFGRVWVFLVCILALKGFRRINEYFLEVSNVGIES
jgi:hypothetical protein